MEYNLR